MGNLIMAGLIWGFLGTVFGAAYWLAGIDRKSSKAGFIILLICAPMWAVAYQFMDQLGTAP